MKKLFLIFIPILISSCGYKSFDSTQNKKLIENTYEMLDSIGGSEKRSFFILPTSLNEIPQDQNNPITEDKVHLGKMLFHDPIIAVNNRDPKNRKTYSCSSCHVSKGGFSSGNFQGIAEGGFGNFNQRSADPSSLFFDVQPIKVPPTLNISFQKSLLWSGELGDTPLNQGTEFSWIEGSPSFFNNMGYEGAETQALAGQMVHGLFDQSSNNALINSFESEILTSDEYLDLFSKAFPNKEGDDLITQETVALAIAAYDRTILSDKAPFQKFLKGDEQALSLNQVRGLNLFLGKARCVQCHSGPALNSMQFHALGFNDFNKNKAILKEENPIAFLGRGGFTQDQKDYYKFKVPQLYNLKDHFSHGHGGSFSSIKEVIEYKNRAISQNKNVPKDNLSPLFSPLNLDEDEINALVDFIENGLYDPQLRRYTPDYVPSNLEFHN